jgi:hypothetical protein
LILVGPCCCCLRFEGLSALFLAQPLPKLVCVSGTQHMLDDGPLLVAQMQGQFEFQCLRNCGHHLQEDAPLELGHALLAFAASALRRVAGSSNSRH